MPNAYTPATLSLLPSLSSLPVPVVPLLMAQRRPGAAGDEHTALL